jgi:hypothetical protein
MGLSTRHHRSAVAFSFVRSARLALHASPSDVTTAAKVPNAAIAAMVYWCALKNSSIMLRLPLGCLFRFTRAKLQRQEP